MSRSKLYFYLLILMLISVLTFVAQLNAQNTDETDIESKRATVQEFIKMAQEFEKKNQIEDAIEIYERIIISIPEDIESKTQLARLYTDTKQHEKAAEIWSTLLETDPDNTKYQESLFNSLQNAGNFDVALELAQAYIQEQPEVGIHYARLAKLQTAQGNDDEAIRNYEKAMEFGHTDKDIYLKLAEHFFINDDIEATEKALKNAIIYTPSEWQRERIDQQLINLYRYQDNLVQMLQKAETEGTISFVMQKELARYYLNNNELEKAADSFKKALEMTNSTYAQNRVAEELLKSYLKQSRTDLALEFYETETSKQPRLQTVVTAFGFSEITVSLSGDNARVTLINAHKNQGNLDKLSNIFEAKLEKDTENPNIIEMLARLYWEANDYKKAALKYHLLSKVEPDNVRSFYYAAAAFHKSNQPEMVEKVLFQADNALKTSNKSRDESFIGALATICLKNGMFEHAIKLAEKSVSQTLTSGNNWELEYHYEILCDSYLGAKRYEEAYETYKRMADSAEDNYTLQQAETEMKEIAKTGNLYEKWIPVQQKHVEQNPNDPNLVMELANSYQATEKYKEAISLYERLSVLEPDNAQWHKKLGDLYQQLPPETAEKDEVIEGTALSLSGNRSFVEIVESETLDNITDMVTISAWIKPTDYPNLHIPIIYRGDERVPDIKNRSYVLHLKRGGIIQLAASPGGESETSIYSQQNVVQLKKWHHIAAVIDAKNDSMQLYINGVNVGKRSFQGKNHLYDSRLPLRIGWTHEEEQPKKASFVGLIDEVRIWNIPRTEEQIRADMDTQLIGNESGLVGYWKFDEETDAIIVDSSPNKNDGKIIGNAKLEHYTRPKLHYMKLNHLPQAITAYQNAIDLDPTSFQYYDLLAKSYLKMDMKSDAEAAYRRALDAPLSQSNHDSVIKAIIGQYPDEGQEDRQIAILEEIKPIFLNSAVLHELLGDLYMDVGETEKAEFAYTEWLQIREKALSNTQNAGSLQNFAEKLLDKGIFPETALKFAKRAFQKNTGTYYDYQATLGKACIANGLYEEALIHYKQGFKAISSQNSLSEYWKNLNNAGKYAKEKEDYLQMLESLINYLSSENSSNRAYAYRIMAQYYSEYDTSKNVENYLLSKTGFVPETRWLTLGPFKNIDSMGHGNAYIPEETIQIDTKAKYYGRDGLISWKKSEYRLLDGHYVFPGENDMSAAYVWGIVISPDERDVTFRFDSDDQGTIWLNGKHVFKHDRTSGLSYDRYTIPVTLKQGENTLLIKVCNSKSSWDFYLRLTDAEGIPIKDLKFKTADELLNALPPEPTFNVNVNLGMAEYYSKNKMHDKAMDQIEKTGIIHENAWYVLSPFDNTAGIGYNTEYIPEDTTQIDLTKEYEGITETLGWKKFTDDAFNGFIDLGRNDNWRVSYAWTTVISPDERDVQLRFGSDDQAKLWLNGKEVFANSQYGWAVIDDNIIPVNLKEGKNTILVKVCNEELSWGFFLRVTDADGLPLKDVQINDATDKN